MSGAWAIVPLLPTIVGIAVTAIVFAVIFGSLASIPRTTTPTNSTITTVGPLIVALFGAIILAYLTYFHPAHLSYLSDLQTSKSSQQPFQPANSSPGRSGSAWQRNWRLRKALTSPFSS